MHQIDTNRNMHLVISIINIYCLLYIIQIKLSNHGQVLKTENELPVYDRPDDWLIYTASISQSIVTRKFQKSFSKQTFFFRCFWMNEKKF